MTEKRICIFGDSIAKGVVLESDGRYTHSPDCFASLLGRERQVENRAVFGCRTGKGLALLKRYADKLLPSDMVLLMFGGNDSDFDWPAVAADPDGFHDCMTPMADFVADIRAMIDLVREKGAQPVLLSMTPFDSRRYFNRLTEKNDRAALLHFLGDTIRMERWNEMYDITLFKLARELKTTIIDLTSPFLVRRKLDNLLCDDGIHPNLQGHQILFKTVKSCLEGLEK